MGSEGRALVIIPTYNEASTIGEAVERVLKSKMLDVLVVDDGSPDGTAGIVASMGSNRSVHLLRRGSKQGLGRAYLAGFEWGLGREYGRILEMDADLSHDPAVAARLVAETEERDLVIGSRYVPGGRVVGWSAGRHALSRAGNLYARVLLGLPIRDSTSGFRCYRRELLEAIDLSTVVSEGYAFQIDMAYRAYRLGFRIKEVPITFVERRTGSSKMSTKITLEALASVTRWGLGDLITARRFRRPVAR